MTRTYQIYLHIICVILVLVGSFNWGLIGTLNFNLIKKINELTFNSNYFENTIYIIVGIASLYLAKNRNIYLPFLGENIIPTSLLKDINNKESNIQIEVDAPDAELVLYWAAEPAGDVSKDGEKHAYDAYNNFSNAGVSTVVNNKALLKIACPQTYWVKSWGIKKTIKKHIHYRLVFSNGWMSEIYTKELNCH